MNFTTSNSLRKRRQFIIYSLISCIFFLTSCKLESTGGQSVENNPFFTTTEPVVVKKISIPVGTKLIYEKNSSTEGEQDKILDEEKLTDIELPIDSTINWGGIPVTSIRFFSNSEMSGFSLYPDFDKLNKKDAKTKFSELWQSCDGELDIIVKNIDDWSFNKKNILDISSCGVNYQRYFKDDVKQQKFLDLMFEELNKNNSK